MEGVRQEFTRDRDRESTRTRLLRLVLVEFSKMCPVEAGKSKKRTGRQDATQITPEGGGSPLTVQSELLDAIPPRSKLEVPTPVVIDEEVGVDGIVVALGRVGRRCDEASVRPGAALARGALREKDARVLGAEGAGTVVGEEAIAHPRHVLQIRITKTVRVCL